MPLMRARGSNAPRCVSCNMAFGRNTTAQERQQEANERRAAEVSGENGITETMEDGEIAPTRNAASAGGRSRSNELEQGQNGNIAIAQSGNIDAEAVTSRETDPLLQADPRAIVGSDAVSKKLGDRLLMGWTMLAEACEKCHTPLVAMGSVKECISCPKNTTTKLTERVPVPSRAPQVNHKIALERPTEPSNQPLKKPRRSTSAPDVESDTLAGLQQTKRDLLSSLSFLREQLNSERTVSSVGDTCDAIAECARAIEAVNFALSSSANHHRR